MTRVLYISIEFGRLHCSIVEALSEYTKAIPVTYSIRGSYKKNLSNSVKCIEYPFSVFKGPILYLHRLRYIAKKCYEIFKDEGITVIHGHIASCDGYICRYLSKLLKIPYVVSVRNTDINLGFVWRVPWIRNSLVEVLRDAKSVVFLSRPYQKQLIEKLNYYNVELQILKKSVIITNGIDDFWISNIYNDKQNPSNTIRILTVGTIDKNKNQIAVAEAIDELYKEGVNIIYRVVGDVKDEEIKRRLEKYPFVSIYPFAEPNELIKFYRNADVFVLASYHETFGLVYAEAMSQGCPIIYTRGQGFDEQFEEGEVGFSVNPHSIDEIKSAIIDVIKNYSELKLCALEHSAKFNWHTIAQQLSEVY